MDLVPGVDLAQAFYDEVVRAVVGRRDHAAALVGTGSDVLGFDTERLDRPRVGPPHASLRRRHRRRQT